VKDPHIHVEKMPVPGFGNAAMRELIMDALGIASDLPKTVGTGCGRRRPIAMTSTVPENVTCLPCREYARAERIRWAEMAESLIGVLDGDPVFAAQAKVTPRQLAEQAREHRAVAGRYEAAR
jgi:hypothetical protein